LAIKEGDRLSSWISKEKRLRIYKRDNFRCRYCGKRLVQGQLSIDHIVPRSKRGTNNEDN